MTGEDFKRFGRLDGPATETQQVSRIRSVMSDTEIPDPQDACGELLHLVEVLHPKLQGDIPIPSEAPEMAAACLSLLRSMVRQAELIILVADPGFSEEASANLRVIFEAWVNLIYLVSQNGDEPAVQYRAFALLEFREHLNSSTMEHGDLEKIDALIDEIRTSHQDVVKQAQLQRSGKIKGKNKLYWSGLGPAQLVQHAAKSIAPIVQDETQLPRFYKFTSWDAHHVLTPVLNVDRDKFRAGQIHLGRRQPPDEAAGFNCFWAAQMIKQASSLVIRRWPDLIDGRNRLTRGEGGDVPNVGPSEG